MKRVAFFLLAVPMTACVVGQTRFKAQQDEAASQKKRADELDAKLVAAQEAARKVSLDLKTTADQLAASSASNKDLQQALDAKKGELSQKVAELIKARDALAQKSAA